MRIWRNIAQASCFLFIGMLVCSCHQTEKEKITRLMEKWNGKELVFPTNLPFVAEDRDTLLHPTEDTSNYKIVTYVDSTGCLSCKLQLLEWMDFISEIDSITRKKVSFYFYFHPKQKKYLITLLKQEGFIFPVCIDTKDEFNQLNQFPENGKFRTFLLNNKNRIILIGNPMHSPQIKELYVKTIIHEQ